MTTLSDRPALIEAARLSLADMGHEVRLVSCQVLALAAVLTPLLVLFGVRYGVVSTLRDRLVEDPRNREIVLVGQSELAAPWFAEMAARPDVAFVIPRTRYIASTVELLPEKGRAATAELIPTAAGDPVLGALPPPAAIDQAVLSARTAERLGVAAGDTVTGSIGRVADGRREGVRLPLTVAAVLPLERFNRDAAFVTLDLLTATEAYREGRAVPALGWPGEPAEAGERRFASFRLYARSIDDVEPLRRDLVGRGLEVRTQAAAIDAVRRLDRNTGLVFWLVAGIGIVGYGLSLAASLVATVERKRPALALLRLVGLPPSGAMVFPQVQALVIGLAGAALALLLYAAAALTVNRLFAGSLEDGQAICRLLPQHVAAAVAATLALAAAAAAFGARRARRIEPGEGLRDV